MTTPILSVALTLLTFGLIAQTPDAQMVPNPAIRIIDGTEYRAEDLRLFSFRVLSNAAPNVLAVRVGTRETMRVDPRDLTYNQRAGAYSSLGGVYTAFKEFAYITNAPCADSKQVVSVRALKIGGNYDCGVPKLCPINTPSRRVSNQSQDKAALERDQSMAEQGDPEHLLRMGDRYAVGRGVPKDLAKAREYYQKAVDKGNSHAKSALKNLPQ